MMYRGKIEVIYGPMFSGKSSELQRRVRRLKYAKKNCLVINYAKDNRYSDEEVASTHDKIMIPAVKVQTLSEVDNQIDDYQVIAVDEGQFFPDLVDKVDQWANLGKTVIIAALDATFQRKQFGRVCELIPIAESITKLTSICVKCGEEASFTMRTVESEQVTLVGGGDMYIPVCRLCFYTRSKENSPVFSCKSSKEGSE